MPNEGILLGQDVASLQPARAAWRLVFGHWVLGSFGLCSGHRQCSIFCTSWLFGRTRSSSTRLGPQPQAAVFCNCTALFGGLVSGWRSGT